VNRYIVTIIAGGLMLGSSTQGQQPPAPKTAAPVVQPANELADSLAQRLSDDLHVKTAVGEPVTVGGLTLIPIMMIDVSFGGAGIAAPSGPAASPQKPTVGGDAFLMTGAVRPLGFVVIDGNKGKTRFISVGKTPAK